MINIRNNQEKPRIREMLASARSSLRRAVWRVASMLAVAGHFVSTGRTLCRTLLAIGPVDGASSSSSVLASAMEEYAALWEFGFFVIDSNELGADDTFLPQLQSHLDCTYPADCAARRGHDARSVSYLRHQ